MSAPALAPLFRSDQQLRILGVLFAGTGDELTVGAIAERARVAQATASREVARLEEHGLLVTRLLGRNRLVRPNWELPWAPELRSILLQTVGVLGRLGNALGGVKGVEIAFVYGSWARRFVGEAGHFPNDIDVVVIGEAPLRAVRAACRAVAEDLRVEVNPIVIDREGWGSPSPEPFVAQIREQPLAPIVLEVEGEVRLAR